MQRRIHLLGLSVARYQEMLEQDVALRVNKTKLIPRLALKGQKLLANFRASIIRRKTFGAR